MNKANQRPPGKEMPAWSVSPVSRNQDFIDEFIIEFFPGLTNQQLAITLDIKKSTLRRICYRLGLKRMELEYFTAVQITFLKKNYRTKGDCELAEIFQLKWPKQKGWTKKHIEKKRKYLHLHRTSQQIKNIHARNVKAGRFRLCPVKAWNKRGVTPEGDIRYWTHFPSGKKYPVIKHKGKFVQWGRWAWDNEYGKIPKGMNVIFKDENPYNLTISNLAILSNKELARLNCKKSSQGLSDNYVAGLLTHGNPSLRQIIKEHTRLLEIKRKQITLNRIIYEQQKNQ